MKPTKRILCGLLALALKLSLLLVGTVTVAYAAKTAEQEAAEQEKAARMAALEQKKKEQADKLKELEKQITDAKKKKEDVMATKNLLDQRNQLLAHLIGQRAAYAEQLIAHVLGLALFGLDDHPKILVFHVHALLTPAWLRPARRPASCPLQRRTVLPDAYRSC